MKTQVAIKTPVRFIIEAAERGECEGWRPIPLAEIQRLEREQSNIVAAEEETLP